MPVTTGAMTIENRIIIGERKGERHLIGMIPDTMLPYPIREERPGIPVAEVTDQADSNIIRKPALK